FLFIGTIHPRKNLKNQLLAFDMIKKANSDSTHKFLIVGTKWIWDKELDEAYSKMDFKNDVVFIGHLPTDELSRVTASATALMYVSVFEGFGIPIIEAFESKTPVITSNTSSMPEVAGNAALIVDPFKPEEIFEAMNIIYKDPDTVNRLIENGLNRKELFSWDLTADKFDKVFVKATETINK
ncbi:MAG: glycosyltransferase family 1 protein, partial [Erysipelotrichaceae bacterium]